jgi:hypothetical protein
MLVAVNVSIGIYRRRFCLRAPAALSLGRQPPLDGGALWASSGPSLRAAPPSPTLVFCTLCQGLPPTTNIRAVAADIKTYQRLSREGGGAAGMHVTADTPREGRQRQYGLKGPALGGEVSQAGGPEQLQKLVCNAPCVHGPKGGCLRQCRRQPGIAGRQPTHRVPPLPQRSLSVAFSLISEGPPHPAPWHVPQVLYTFPPPGMPADLRDSLAAFCFPHGVRPELLERTPSMSGAPLDPACCCQHVDACCAAPPLLPPGPPGASSWSEQTAWAGLGPSASIASCCSFPIAPLDLLLSWRAPPFPRRLHPPTHTHMCRANPLSGPVWSTMFCFVQP